MHVIAAEEGGQRCRPPAGRRRQSSGGGSSSAAAPVRAAAAALGAFAKLGQPASSGPTHGAQRAKQILRSPRARIVTSSAPPP